MTLANRTESSTPPLVEYPDSDGEPMAENTEQWEWLVTLKGNLDAFIPDFVASDLLWYPVEGDPTIRQAPDALVAIGRPKGRRGSYRQWEENGIAPQVVFEIWSPGNRFADFTRKLAFYDRYGVEEYYLYDPDRNDLTGWCRRDGRLDLIDGMNGHVSPRLGVRFTMPNGVLVLYRPDGSRFLTFAELESARQAAERRAETESRRADDLAAEVETLRAKLRAAGIDPGST